MFELVSFSLEDFFDEYEHRAGLINLASSDALPWSSQEIRNVCPEFNAVLNRLDFSYPNAASQLVPALRAYLGTPAGQDVLPTSGTAEAIWLAFLELFVRYQSHATIAIPDPCYGAFEGIAKLLGFRIEKYRYEAERCWALQLEQLFDLAQRSQIVVVCNPHNPTGSALALDDLRNIAELTERGEGTLLVDEVFRSPDELPSCLGLTSNTLVVASLSKTYGLPGLRLGWIAGIAGRIKAFRTLRQYSSLAMCSLTVECGTIVLDRPRLFSRQDLLRTNRAVVQEWAYQNSDYVKISSPAFGTTVCLEPVFPADETFLFERLFKEGVLVVPGGRCFGEARYPWFRLGYGTKTETLERGLDLVAAVFREGNRH